MERISHEDLMRYLDDEMPSGERQRVDAAVARSTELQRELAIYRAMKRDFQELSFAPALRGSSTWDRVNRKLTRPVGWLLLVVGVAVWSAYGAWLFLTSPGHLVAKLADAAVTIGLVLLLASAAWDRYREWLTDPYRDVQR